MSLANERLGVSCERGRQYGPIADNWTLSAWRARPIYVSRAEIHDRNLEALILTKTIAYQ